MQATVSVTSSHGAGGTTGQDCATAWYNLHILTQLGYPGQGYDNKLEQLSWPDCLHRLSCTASGSAIAAALLALRQYDARKLRRNEVRKVFMER